ncbi:flagellar hook-basal body complex protein [bacterium 1XD42-1]|nr:flagellar hook-basal body complex protein [bacterium 1XD42-8]RKJ67661.1 flagellar hook-basal body complex protein [bacterium 1XD42-1]
MVRSMYSGVSGMRSHQTAMDTIGNNIANVNTYGFKGSRTTFSDIYYQSLRGASAASSTRGGVNHSQIGVGAQVRSVDLMMTRQSFTQTDMTMDVALDGEGFLQIMDADGNKYYTRAGQLNFDANGNLVDSKGNFVLGTNGDPFGKDPGSEKIQVNLGSVNPAAAKAEETIDGVLWTITAENTTDEGNVGISFVSDKSMPSNQECVAEVTDSGIVVRLNGNMKFTSDSDLSTKVNDAIKKACQEKTQSDHPAGNFTITSGLDWGSGLTGEELCNTSKKVTQGTISGTSADFTQKGYRIDSDGFGSKFGDNASVVGATDGTVTVKFTAGTKADPDNNVAYKAPVLTVEMKLGDVTYTGTTSSIAEGSQSLILYNPNDKTKNDYLTLKIPDISKYLDEDRIGFGLKEDGKTAYTQKDLTDELDVKNVGAANATDATKFELNVTASKQPEAHCLSSKTIVLSGGTKGGPQGIDSLTGVSIGTDGVISGQHSLLGDVILGRIDVAVFVNPSGLGEAGGTYFTSSPNTGGMTITKPGEKGSGQLVAGALEMSNVDLAREFTDMIKTQRGYQANGRIITVTDTMLEELVNLKR